MFIIILNLVVVNKRNA